MADPFVGKLAFFRVYSGKLAAGSYVYNSTKDKRERLGRIVKMHANHREEVDVVMAGDIAAAVGLKDVGTGDTLCDEKNPIVLESMVFPEPVIRVAIEPKTKAGRDKMGVALMKLAEEDPRHLKPIPMRKLARPSLQAWASCTWKLSWIACCENTKWRQW